MRPLNEILQSLKEKYGYTDREIAELSRQLDLIVKVSYTDYTEQKRLAEKHICGKQHIKE